MSFPFTVIATKLWDRTYGGPQAGGGIEGKITFIRFEGVTAYVRENIRVDTFMINSGHRRGLAEQQKLPPGVEVLELATFGDFARIASVIAAADALCRPVVPNPKWSVKLAAWCMRQPGVAHV